MSGSTQTVLSAKSADGKTSAVGNILLVGVGGQGIVLTSDIITLAAMKAGFDAKKSEIHGMSQRGGSVFSHVRFGPKVWSPLLSEGSADILLSMEEMETLRWARFAGPATRTFICMNRILPAGVTEYPTGITEMIDARFAFVARIDPKDALAKIGNPKTMNTYLAGVVSGLLPFAQDVWEGAVAELVPEKTIEANLTAFRAGRADASAK
jgi:indolepyruvate ferredoxin oxidoreductase beta subunit